MTAVRGPDTWWEVMDKATALFKPSQIRALSGAHSVRMTSTGVSSDARSQKCNGKPRNLWKHPTLSISSPDCAQVACKISMFL